MDLKRQEPWRDALQKNRATLASAIAGKSEPDMFGDLLVGEGFITEQVKRDRVNLSGVGAYSKITNLLDAVSADINSAGNKEKSTTRFNAFIKILKDLGLEDAAKQLTDYFSKYKYTSNQTSNSSNKYISTLLQVNMILAMHMCHLQQIQQLV